MSLNATSPRGPLVLLCSHTSNEGSEDDIDTWHAAEEIGHALSARWSVEFLDGNDPGVLAALGAKTSAGAIVFNLMERPQDAGWPAILEQLGLPYTGCDSFSLLLSTHKPRMKLFAEKAGLSVAAGVTVRDAIPDDLPLSFPVILKPVAEESSVGIDQDSVCFGLGALERQFEARRRRLPGAWLIEEYIPGTDLALSLFAENGEAHVLPMIEVPFDAHRKAVPILCHETKWQQQDAAFGSLGERCPTHLLAHIEAPLLAGVRRLVKELDLTGHARLDFRLDERRQPWFLELNANPRISERNCYFIAAAAAAGLDFRRVLEWLIETGLRRRAR